MVVVFEFVGLKWVVGVGVYVGVELFDYCVEFVDVVGVLVGDDYGVEVVGVFCDDVFDV